MLFPGESEGEPKEYMEGIEKTYNVQGGMRKKIEYCGNISRILNDTLKIQSF